VLLTIQVAVLVVAIAAFVIFERAHLMPASIRTA
jgi:hypothetical protein